MVDWTRSDGLWLVGAALGGHQVRAAGWRLRKRKESTVGLLYLTGADPGRAVTSPEPMIPSPAQGRT